MDLAALRLLLTPHGQAALQEAARLQPREADFLAHFTLLQRRYAPSVARTALETAILRQEAGRKFPQAEHMYFTRPALEQATSAEVARYRAERFQGYRQILDLGCSIGSDSLALAQFAPVIGLDLDPLRLAMAQANQEALPPTHPITFLRADLRQPLPVKLPPDSALFFDPARRTTERRIFSVRDYQPPLEQVHVWQTLTPAIGVKISPGVKLEEIESFEAEVEFISLRGELKEAVLWFGPLRRSLRRATLLPGPFTLSQEGPPTASLPLMEPQAYLYEPDPAVLRAGLVSDLGHRLQAGQMDADIAYLTGNHLVATPFAQAYPIEEWMPFQLKRLRAALRAKGVGQLIVKKRGSPITPEALIHDLKLKGDARRVIFLTHLQGRPIVILSTGRVELDSAAKRLFAGEEG